MRKPLLTVFLIMCFLYPFLIAKLEASAKPCDSPLVHYLNLPVHNLNTSKDYATIQEAIDDSETLTGHIIRADAGTYLEHVTITKSISLVGEGRDTTIVDGNGTGTVIQISVSDVSVINFTVRNAGRIWQPSPWHLDSCIQGKYVMNVRIENNTFTGAAVCVWFDHSSLLNASDNLVFNATYAGIIGYATSNFTIYHNLVYDYGSDGIHLDGGSSNCRIINNTVKNGFIGISLETDEESLSATANNLIDGNYIFNNTLSSIGLWKCGINVFRRNNMTNKQHNLVVWGNSLASFMQDIDDSNTVNNKVLYYLTNRNNLMIEPSSYPNLGDLAIVNCTNIMIRDFNLTSNGDGILLACSTNCTLMNLTLSDNHEPIIYGGFPFIYGGLMFFESNNNTIVNNKICNNSYGACLYHSNWNVFYHNSFLENDKQVITDFLSPFSNKSSGYLSGDVWDNGFEGNYWSDYTGLDQNKDGIGDTAHVIDANNQDNYPLMGMFSSHSVPPHFGYGLTVTVISNSTILDFSVARVVPYSITNSTSNSTSVWGEASETRFIMFNITGESGLGFCRLCIPKALMAPPYTVLINNGLTSPIYYNEALLDNGTHRWIYFTYFHPITYKVWIWGQEDITPPVIANVTQQPTKENVYPSDKVTVYANVTDLSGVKQVILNYTTNNGTWFVIEMTNLEGNLYNATIPKFPYGTNVTYVIIAVDNVNNTITTEEMGHEYQYRVIPEFPSNSITIALVTTSLVATIVAKKRRKTLNNRQADKTHPCLRLT